MTILQYQLAQSINGFRNNNWFWTTFMKFVLEWTAISIQFTIPSINTVPWWSFIAKNLIKLTHVESCKKNLTKMFTISFHFLGEINLLSYCKQHKWRSYVKTFCVRLTSKISSFTIELADYNTRVAKSRNIKDKIYKKKNWFTI